MYKEKFENLVNDWRVIEKNTQDSIKWVEHNRKENTEIQYSADDVLKKLTEIEITSRKMASICGKPCSIGLFGESQAGKSYLVSSIAGDDNNAMKTFIGGRNYDFIRDINPQGGGKESTGLVTRFSMNKDDYPSDDYPVKLHLLTETEIVMILVNSYYEDQKEAPDVPSDDELNLTISRLEQGSENKQISIDEIYALRDYFNNNQKKLSRALHDNFWGAAIRCLPTVSLEQRAEFYSVLWGDIEQFTNLFIKLATYINKIKNDTIYVQVEALKPSNNEERQYSIINVDALKLIDKEDKKVYYYSNDFTGRIPIGILAAITSELCINIANCKHENILKKMDLLDFPGYRGRLKDDFSNLGTSKSNSVSSLSEIFLRGKVSYLFEKYVDNRELNCLIVCCASNNQINTDIESVISRWVIKTQGQTPEDRASHQPGLFWAITKFDLRLNDELGKIHEFGKGGLLYQTLLEKFGNSEWLKNWNDSNDAPHPKPFSNVFLVRKTCQGFSLIKEDRALNRELGFNEDFNKDREEMFKSFIEDPEVNKYFENATEAWDSVMSINDGGISRLCNAIENTDAEQIRYNLLTNLLKKMAKNGENQINKWYTSGNIEDNREKVKKAFNPIMRDAFSTQKDLCSRFGEFLNNCNLPDTQIRYTYLYGEDPFVSLNDDKQDEESSITEDFEQKEEIKDTLSNSDIDEGNSLDDDFDFDFDLLRANEKKTAAISKVEGAEEENLPNTQNKNMKNAFGTIIFYKWLNYLKNLSEDEMPTLKIPSDYVHTITNELITYAKRSDLLKRLNETTTSLEKFSQSKESACDSMVTTVSMMLSDFIIDIAEYSKIKKAENNFDEYGFPILSEENPEEHASILLKEFWFKNLWKNVVAENLKHATTTGLPVAENTKLGSLIAQYNRYGN